MESEPRHQKPVRRGWQWFYQCRMAEPYADDPRAFDESFGISRRTDASEECLAVPRSMAQSAKKELDDLTKKFSWSCLCRRYLCGYVQPHRRVLCGATRPAAWHSTLFSTPATRTRL